MAGELVQAAQSIGGLSQSLWVQSLGWIGQGFFSARVLIQWVASERERRPVAPRIFWVLSAAGALLMSAYCLIRGEPVLVPGFVLTFAIYLRNLRIKERGSSAERPAPPYFLFLGLCVAVGTAALGVLGDHDRAPAPAPWLAVAIAGQALWIGRFLVQWRHSEHHGTSMFPPAFWWMTIAGSTLNTAYSLHRVDLPLIFGFVLSWIAPARNLMLHHRHQKATS